MVLTYKDGSYPFDYNLLKERNLKNEEVIDKLKSIYD